MSHPVVASSTKSATTFTPMMCQAPSAAASGAASTTLSALKASERPAAATLSDPKTVTTNSISTKSTPDHRPYGCSHCNQAFRVEVSLRQHYKDSHPKRLIEVFGQTCDTCKKSFLGLNALQDHQRAKKHCYCHECEIVFECESTASSTSRPPTSPSFDAVTVSKTSSVRVLLINISIIRSIKT